MGTLPACQAWPSHCTALCLDFFTYKIGRKVTFAPKFIIKIKYVYFLNILEKCMMKKGLIEYYYQMIVNMSKFYVLSEITQIHCELPVVLIFLFSRASQSI